MNSFHRIFLLTFFTCCPGLPAQDAAIRLMPVPAQMAFSGQGFRLDESFTLKVSGVGADRLYSYATRVLRRLSGRTGLFFSQDFIRKSDSAGSASLMIKSKKEGQVLLGEDESYTLVVSDSVVILDAATDLGALRGLETLLQLLSVDGNGYFFPGVRIVDTPRFPWRGLLIDACRHFMPVEVVKRNLDAMAAVKLNVLHWHLSEDQGFRVESKVYPKLHELGSDGFYYAQAQIKDVVDYAEQRGIRVVPEFDVPGHATSWLVAYPELASAPGPYMVERKWGIFYPVLNPATEFTYTFLSRFFGEMAQLFPDPYFHIGGDEIEHEGGHEAKHWNENADIQAFMQKNGIADNAGLQAYFNRRVLEILTGFDKIMVGWDEILHEDIPRNIVIQSWRGRDSMTRAAQMGYRSLLSNGYYIDHISPTDFHYLNDPLPADLPLSEQERKNILGGEATMWAEFVSPETIDSRIWPRTAAIAERLWSPRSVTDVDDMYRRLEIISLQLEEHGLTHEKNYDMLLRRLAGGGDIAPLKTLVDVLEPVKVYTRGRQKAYTSHSPLTRVVDAARPDAKVARRFRKAVDRFLTSTASGDEAERRIVEYLSRWRDNHLRLQELIAVSPILAEIGSLSEDLSKISHLGLEAVSSISQQKKRPDSWVKQSLASVKQASKPRGQAELMVVAAMEKLIISAGSMQLQR